MVPDVLTRHISLTLKGRNVVVVRAETRTVDQVHILQRYDRVR
jgi:hypothetical protein